MNVIVESALFGRPKSVPLTTQAVTVPTAPAAAPLTLKAIVGGPPWQAMLAGVAGEPEIMVGIGSGVRGLRVQSITRETVVLRSGDSTLTLTMRPTPR